MQKILISIIVLVVLCVLIRVAIHFYSENRTATGLIQNANGQPGLSGCEDLLNCTASTATNARNRTEPFAYSGPANELMEKLSTLINTLPGASVLTSEPRYLHATFKTRLLGYTDDLEMVLDENDQLHIRSASRIGKSDLGANRKRIEALRTLVDGKI